MSRSTNDDRLVLAGEPRVNLLPPEVTEQARARSLRRTLILATGGVLLVVVVGIGAAFWHSGQSALRLAAAQADSLELLTEQGKYIEVKQVQTEVDTALAARAVGSATEIDWTAYLKQVRDKLPLDVTVDGVVLDSSSPLAPYVQPTAPLQASRVATLSITVGSPTLPSVPAWLEALQGLPGFADAVPGSITQTATGGYTVALTMHINSDAFAQRFAVAPADDAATQPDAVSGVVADSTTTGGN